MKYLISYRLYESLDDEVCKYINDNEYQYWRDKIIGIPNNKAIEIIKKQIDEFEREYSKTYDESKFKISKDRVTYNGNPIYGPNLSPDLIMAVSYCDDEWYLVECFHGWYFYTFLCDDLVGLEKLGKTLIEKIDYRGGRQ